LSTCQLFLPEYIAEWKKMSVCFDAILTGYMADAKQVEIISNFIDDFKGDGTLIFVDPVMADDGALYDTYDKTLCEKVKALTTKANVITPNLTELCILCNADYSEISKRNHVDEIGTLAKSLISDTTKTVIVTGVKNESEILNIIVDKDNTSVVKATRLNGSYSGTGDIFSSVVCGGITKGMSIFDAVSLATDFIYRSIKSTPTRLSYEPDGVNFQKHLEMFINAE
jgi:pyridoxine kinase